MCYNSLTTPLSLLLNCKKRCVAFNMKGERYSQSIIACSLKESSISGWKYSGASLSGYSLLSNLFKMLFEFSKVRHSLQSYYEIRKS